MWTSVYMTQNIDNARNMRIKIQEKKIIVMLRRITFYENKGEDCYELLVPGAEVSEALDIIIDEK